MILRPSSRRSISRCDAGGPFHRRRRSRALYRTPRDGAGRQGRTHRRRAAPHAEDRRESRRPADGSVRRHSRGSAKDRSQFYKDLAIQFYGANRPGAKVSQGMLDQFWLWSMQAGLKNAYECIKAFSETDFTEDLKKFDVPTLVMHGEDDQIVPVNDSARKSAQAHQGREGNLLSRRAARPDRHASGSGQRRSAGLPPELVPVPGVRLQVTLIMTSPGQGVNPGENASWDTHRACSARRSWRNRPRPRSGPYRTGCMPGVTIKSIRSASP